VTESIRKEYQKSTLGKADLSDNPFEAFAIWMDQALHSDLPEPTAMNLATVGDNGGPSSRTVLLKGFDASGFRFFTNHGGRKAQEIENNPFVSLQFLWKELERQVRIEGKATKLDEEASEAYFRTRPRLSRIAAWASPQSTIVPDRETLERLFQETEERFKDQEDIPKPPFWGGYVVKPDTIEFWQGRPMRLHDRIRFRAKEDGWIKERLSP